MGCPWPSACCVSALAVLLAHPITHSTTCQSRWSALIAILSTIRVPDEALGCWTALGIHTSRHSPGRRYVDNSVRRETSWVTTPCTSGPLGSTRMAEGKPTRTAGAQRRGAEAARQQRLDCRAETPRRPPTPRRRDDQAASVTTSMVADRRSVVIIVASFVCKTSVGQHTTNDRRHVQRPRGEVRQGRSPSVARVAEYGSMGSWRRRWWRRHDRVSWSCSRARAGRPGGRWWVGARTSSGFVGSIAWCPSGGWQRFLFLAVAASDAPCLLRSWRHSGVNPGGVPGGRGRVAQRLRSSWTPR